MRLVGSDRKLTEISVNDSAPVKRDKDGTFHVDGPGARALVKSGDFAVAGTTFRNAVGYVCRDCGFVGLLLKCKCGSTDTYPDTETDN
jgi:hypothetical protein